MRERRKLWLSLQPPLWYDVLVRAEGWRFWTDKMLDDDPVWRRCHICGRREDFLFDFARLITLWDGERVVRECRWHGPKEVIDCRTGEEIVVPEPPRYPRFQGIASFGHSGAFLLVPFGGDILAIGDEQRFHLLSEGKNKGGITCY